jgi:hypothetical protein
MKKVKFDAKWMKQQGLPYSAIFDKLVDHTRWSVVHEIVFENRGKFYKTRYSVGATESQAEEPWEYEDEVECTEVHIVEKLVKTWENV